MMDHDVGELWRSALTARGIQGKWWAQKCAELIRKLVEERAQLLSVIVCDYDGNYLHDSFAAHMPEALVEFGIDPTTYPQEKP